ncbi:MAG: HAMP domain-containing protein, partial [Nevskiales bacterium]
MLNILAVRWTQSSSATAAQALETMRKAEAVRFQMMQNRLYLANYLQSGDTREVSALNAGVSGLRELLGQVSQAGGSEQQRAAFGRVRDAEAQWQDSFAKPLIEKRKQVDEGNATVADLQIFYLEQDPAEWLRKSIEPLDEASKSIMESLDESRASSRRASTFTWIATGAGTLLALLGGAWIAFFTAKSITQPLSHLIRVSREIGNSGDLEHKVDIQRNDEIGELAQTFNNMVTYLREMAALSEAIAGGDLTISVTPRSERDTLAHAFSSMADNLRGMVKEVRDGASQVSSGAVQVADASEDSAKVSVTASSAIDEVTSTMHEMSINVQNMVRNTQTQASNVSETSASIDQMVASIQRVADTARNLVDISQRSRDEVQS